MFRHGIGTGAIYWRSLGPTSRATFSEGRARRIEWYQAIIVGSAREDPLSQIKREDVFVADRLGTLQEILNKNERARRLDPDQTLIEKAYAAAMAFRWNYVNRPHRWQKKRPPKWSVVGFLLDEVTEKYLLILARRRIDRMTKTTQELLKKVT